MMSRYCGMPRATGSTGDQNRAVHGCARSLRKRRWMRWVAEAEMVPAFWVAAGGGAGAREAENSFSNMSLSLRASKLTWASGGL